MVWATTCKWVTGNKEAGDYEVKACLIRMKMITEQTRVTESLKNDGSMVTGACAEGLLGNSLLPGQSTERAKPQHQTHTPPSYHNPPAQVRQAVSKVTCVKGIHTPQLLQVYVSC